MNVASQQVTYLVLGATGGIGKAVCHALEKQGARLILGGRNQNRLDELASELSQPAQTLGVDINVFQDRCLILETLIAQQANHVINLTGINQFSLFVDQTDADIERIVQTNLTSVLCLNRMLIEHFQTVGAGLIVNVGSALGQIGFPGYATYSATKFALRGFCEAMSRELSDTAIDVKYFSPRATDTEINSSAANDMNKALGNKVDSPERVANELVSFIRKGGDRYQVGWPEKLFTRVNGVFPNVVSQQINKQLPIIKKYLKSEV